MPGVGVCAPVPVRARLIVALTGSLLPIAMQPVSVPMFVGAYATVSDTDVPGVIVTGAICTKLNSVLVPAQRAILFTTRFAVPLFQI